MTFVNLTWPDLTWSFPGVLWHEDRVIGRADLTLNALQAMGKKVFYVTNNSTKSRDDYVNKCEKIGFKATKVDTYLYFSRSLSLVSECFSLACSISLSPSLSRAFLVLLKVHIVLL